MGERTEVLISVLKAHGLFAVCAFCNLVIGLFAPALHLYSGLSVYIPFLPSAFVALLGDPLAGFYVSALGAIPSPWPVVLAIAISFSALAALFHWLCPTDPTVPTAVTALQLFLTKKKGKQEREFDEEFGGKSILAGWKPRHPVAVAFVALGLVLLTMIVATFLSAVGFSLLFQFDGGQFGPSFLAILAAWIPTILVVSILGALWVPLWRRFRWIAAAVAVVVVIAAAAVAGDASIVTNPTGVSGGFGSGTLRAGAAVVDITPSAEMMASGVYMGGYGGRSGPATGVHDPIFARTLVLDVGPGVRRVVFAQIDAVGFGSILGARLRSALSEAAGNGTAEVNVLVSATHSHAAPDLQGMWGGVPSEFEDSIVEGLSKAVRSAVAGLREATLQAACGSVEGMTFNRRGWNTTQKELHVLQAVAGNGSVIGTLVNFACHPTVLPRENMLLSADFVSGLLSGVEEAQGGVALYINGPEGDVIPVKPDPLNTTVMYNFTDSFGRSLADRANSAIFNSTDEMALGANVTISIHTALVNCALEYFGFQLLLDLGMLRYNLRNWGLLPGFVLRVSLVRLSVAGQQQPFLTMVTVPGEMTTRLGAHVVDIIGQGRENTAILGLTDEAYGYIISRDEWYNHPDTPHPINEETVSVGPLMEKVVTGALSDDLEAAQQQQQF